MRTTVSCVLAREYVLVAPQNYRVPSSFGNVQVGKDRYERLLHEMQRVRGRIYLQDGAIEHAHLTPDGRHHLEADADSWHLLLLEDGHVAGCMRYCPYSNWDAASQLAVFRSTQARSPQWGRKLTTAVREELYRALREGIGFGEAGGWALTEEVRFSSEALRMVLATFCLAQLLGEAIVFSTATSRNGSAPILRRIGGRALMSEEEEIPAYFDHHYNCEMQILRFDSRYPNPKYKMWVDQLRENLLRAPVVCQQFGKSAAPRHRTQVVAVA